MLLREYPVYGRKGECIPKRVLGAVKCMKINGENIFMHMERKGVIIPGSLSRRGFFAPYRVSGPIIVKGGYHAHNGNESLSVR